VQTTAGPEKDVVEEPVELPELLDAEVELCEDVEEDVVWGVEVVVPVVLGIRT
jgi:hypothetical protein